MNIFEELRQEHEYQRSLLRAISETVGPSETRKNLYRELKRSMTLHANSEERYLYKQLIEEDVTQGKARHSIAEHKELDDYIERLDETDMSSPGWLTIFKSMADRLKHHLDEEEREFFPVAGKALGAQQKTRLAKEYRQYMDAH